MTHFWCRQAAALAPFLILDFINIYRTAWGWATPGHLLGHCGSVAAWIRISGLFEISGRMKPKTLRLFINLLPLSGILISLIELFQIWIFIRQEKYFKVEEGRFSQYFTILIRTHKHTLTLILARTHSFTHTHISHAHTNAYTLTSSHSGTHLHSYFHSHCFFGVDKLQLFHGVNSRS
jgi:hypothetical protein